MIDWKAADGAVKLMNELLAADPEAVHNLCEIRVGCNDELANHPTVQVAGYPSSPVVTDDTPKYAVGLVGILNGLIGALGPEGTDKEGWGVLASVYDKDRVVSFKLLKCEQCCYPHYDGICECGGWGPEEDYLGGNNRLTRVTD